MPNLYAPGDFNWFGMLYAAKHDTEAGRESEVVCKAFYIFLNGERFL